MPGCEDCEDLTALLQAWERRLTVAEQLNAELARMLRSLEWDVECRCPSCGGLGPGAVVDPSKAFHTPDCALAALLKKATTL